MRVYRLDYQELRGDEAFGYFFSLRSFHEIVQSTLALKEPHPVASYFLEHLWLNWAGQSEFALRFMNVWFGTLAVALIYRLGRRLDFTPFTACLAAFLLALSPYAIWHSQDARMYSMSLALTLASTWLAIEWLPRQRWPQAVAYLAVSWLALHTHYFSVFVLAAQTIFIVSRALISPRLRFTVFNWLTLQGVLAAFYLPWFTQISGILTNYGGNGDSPEWLAMLRRSLSVFAVGESLPTNPPWLWATLAALFLGLGGYALWQNAETGRRALWLLMLYLLVPLLATWYGAQQRPIFNERYLIAAVPPFYLLIAAAIKRLTIDDLRLTRLGENLRFRLWHMGVGILFLTLITGDIFALNNYYHNPVYSKTRGWRALATTLQQLTASLPAGQVRITQNFPDPTLWYYYRGPVEHLVLPPAAHDLAGARKSVAELQAAGVQRVILPVQPAPNWDDRNVAATALDTHYGLIKEIPVNGWPVQIYTAAPASFMPRHDEFRNGVSLTGAAFQPQTLTPGNLLVVQLAWQALSPKITGTEKVFVQLLNSSGQLVAQDDRPLAAQSAFAVYGILLPADLPAGDYRLIAGLYDPAQTGAPRVHTNGGTDFVEIATLQVATK
ncbi:MAG: glycosyltransferase family 39 protein [Chloroflexi bacterium]|nr:glycosyltransferase family 39 protein [Chloroflexota bacterium]